MRNAQGVVIAIHGCGEVKERLPCVPWRPSWNDLVAERRPREVAQEIHAERDNKKCEPNKERLSAKHREARRGV